MKLVSRIADAIQEATGEKRRRQLVRELKGQKEKFKQKVSGAIMMLNHAIAQFNQAIKRLNSVRSSFVKENIESLFGFLSKFGRCKPYGEYIEESTKLPASFPEKDMTLLEDYIRDVDWSKDEVFLKTVVLTPFGMKMKTRTQNLSMQERLHEIQLLIEETVRELNDKEYFTELETKICAMYIDNVEFISAYIKKNILPEFELIEAFFQAEKVKDEILSGHPLRKLSFSYAINSLMGTAYDMHYRFVKNAFLFYVLSCKIYDTPVLSNLLNNQTTEDDLKRLKGERGLLEAQTSNLNSNMAITRGGVA